MLKQKPDNPDILKHAATLGWIAREELAWWQLAGSFVLGLLLIWPTFLHLGALYVTRRLRAKKH